MITHTSDIFKVPLLRKFSSSDKVLPSVQYKIELEGLTGSITIIDFSHGSARVRAVLELLTVMSMGTETAQTLENLIDSDFYKNYEITGLQKFIKDVRKNRLVDNNYSEQVLYLTEDIVNKLVKTLKDNSCTIFSQGLIINGVTRKPLESINIDYFREIWGETFERMLKGISSKDEFLGMASGRYFFPEDIYVGREYHTLSSLNTMSGNNYVGYQSLKEAYYLSEHFRNNPDFFNATHCSCGAELVIRIKDGNYTVMQCINPYCYEKLSHSIADFAVAMGIDGLGPTTIMNAVRNTALVQLANSGDINVDYRKLLKESLANILAPAAGNLWMDFLESIKNYNGTLKELIVNMNLPYLADEASKVLHYGVLSNPDLTPNMLAKEASMVGKKDMKFVLNLWLNLESINYVVFEMATKTHLEPVNEYLIYITKGVLLQLDDGSVIKHTKKQFIDLINSALRNIGETSIKIKLSGSLTYKCNALIADQDRDTGSCATAESYGIPIFTSREFLQSLGGVSNVQQ